jgi:hypothetical protein
MENAVGLIDDLRLDIGDDEELFAEACSPEIWCATVVTDKVYDKKQTDTILFVNPTLPGPTIINLGASPILGKICVIKDMKGDANVNPIIIRSLAAHTIDSFTEFHITQRYQAYMLTWNGVEWNII